MCECACGCQVGEREAIGANWQRACFFSATSGPATRFTSSRRIITERAVNPRQAASGLIRNKGTSESHTVRYFQGLKEVVAHMERSSGLRLRYLQNRSLLVLFLFLKVVFLSSYIFLLLCIRPRNNVAQQLER